MRLVTVNAANVYFNKQKFASGDRIIITDSEYAALVSARRFLDGTLTDGGVPTAAQLEDSSIYRTRIESDQQDLLAILNRRATSQGGAHLVGGTQMKWRREFNDPTLAEWVEDNSGGLDFVVSGGVATVAMGTAANASAMLTSKQSFSAPFKVAVGLSLSQKIANNEIYVEVVAENSDGSVSADPSVVAAWRIAGSDSVTTTNARTEVRNGGAARSQSANIASQVAQTGTGGVYEITLESDEVWFSSKGVDSTSSRSAPFVRNSISPDPNKRYRVRLRVLNGSSAPASTTTVTFSFVTCVDYTEIQTEVTGGNGSIGGGQAVPIYLTGGVPTGTTNAMLAAVATVAGTAIAKVLSAASVNNTLVKSTAGRIYGWQLSNNGAAWRYVKIYNKATAPVAGTDTPVMTIPVGPGQSVLVAHTVPISLATGIGYAITANPADNDATVVAANEMVGHILYI